MGFSDAELARLEAILARLAPDDRAVVGPLVLPGWLLRRRRLAERNGLIREARRRFFADRRVTVAAKQLAAALGGYALTGWRWEKQVGLPEQASARHRALYAILIANGGSVLSWRRIAEIFGPARNGTVLLGTDAIEATEIAEPGWPCDHADRRGS
jgi:hypothetical protein